MKKTYLKLIEINMAFKSKNLKFYLPHFLFLILLGCTLSIYWQGLYGPLLLDDYPQLIPIIDNISTENIKWWRSLLSDSGPLKRPISMATFLLNAIYNGRNIFAWKFTNLIIHLIIALILFFLTAHIYTYNKKIISRHSWRLPTILSSLWLLHPLHVSTVLYTVQRMAQLSALFVFSGLLTYIIGRKRQILQNNGYWLIAISFILFIPLSAFSKENGLLLPLFLLITELFLFRFHGEKHTKRYLTIFFIIFLFIPLLICLYYFIFHMSFSLNYDGRPFTLYQRVLTEFRVLWLYIFQLILPIQRTMGFFHDDFIVSHGWLTPPTTIISFFGISILLFITYFVRNSMPLLAFGIIFFFVGHLLESTVLPLELIYEHRNYLPSYGVFLAIFSLFYYLNSNISPTTKKLMVVAILFFLSTLTFIRVQTWSSYTSFYNYAYQIHPQSYRVTATIAEELTRQEHYNDALSILAPVNGNGPMLQRLYIQCMRDHTLEPQAINNITDSLSSPIDDQSLTGILELARLGLENTCNIPLNQYSSLLTKAETLNTRSAKDKYKIALYNAQYQWKLGKKLNALSALERAHLLKQDTPIPLFLKTEWLIEMRNIQQAKISFSRAKEIAAASKFSYDELISKINSKFHSVTIPH